MPDCGFGLFVQDDNSGAGNVILGYRCDGETDRNGFAFVVEGFVLGLVQLQVLRLANTKRSGGCRVGGQSLSGHGKGQDAGQQQRQDSVAVFTHDEFLLFSSSCQFGYVHYTTGEKGCLSEREANLTAV